MSDKKEAKNTWVVNDSGRKQFWAAATAAGLSEDNVHEVFGVESMYDFPGTLVEAIGTIKEWEAAQPPGEPSPEAPAPAEPDGDGEPEQPADDGLAEKLAYRAQQQPESPVLAWTKFETPAGFVWHVSVRAGLPPDLARLALRQTVAQIRLFEEGAEKMKWLPVTDGRDVTALPQRAAAQPSAGAGPPAPPSGAVLPPPTAQGSNGAGVEETDFVRVTAPKGRAQVEFWRSGRKYPELQWNLGGEKLVQLAPWMAEAGWSAAHFDAIGAEYQLPLVVHWEPSPKNAKYKDIMALEPRS